MNTSSASIVLNIAIFRNRMFGSLLSLGSATGSSFAEILSRYQAASDDSLAALNLIAPGDFGSGSAQISRRL